MRNLRPSCIDVTLVEPSTCWWCLKDFPGSTWDAKLAYALANVETGTGILFPSTPEGQWIDFEGDYVIDTWASSEADEGANRVINLIGNKSRVKYHGTGTWLTISAQAANPNNAQCLVRGLHIEPDTDVHYVGDAIRISNTGRTLVQECGVYRFNNGILLANNDSFTENTRIQSCDIRGNRVGIKGTTIGTGYEGSQRGTQIINTFLGTTYTPPEYISDKTGTEGSIWHYCMFVDKVSWYHGTFIVNLGIKRNYSVGIRANSGRFAGSYGYFEGEGTKKIYDHVIGVWISDSEEEGAKPASFRGCNFTFSIGSIADGEEEIDLEDPLEEDVGSALIYDERTEVTKLSCFGEFKLRGSNFYTKYPLADGNVLYQIIPKEDSWSNEANYDMGLKGIADTDGKIFHYEYLTHDKTDGYNRWVESYYANSKELVSSLNASEIPLWLGCTPFNEENLGIESLVHGAGSIQIDQNDVEIGDTTVHMDGFTTKFSVGELFTVNHLGESYIYQVTDVACARGSIRLDIPSAVVVLGQETVHMDGFFTFFVEGEIFTVEGDATLYTVVEVTQKSGDQADVTFTPGVVTPSAWTNNTRVTVDVSSTDADITFTPEAQTAWSNDDNITIDTTYTFIDISKENPGIVRISTDGTLNQIRGGQKGQRLAFNNLNTSFILKHYVDVNQSVLVDGAVTTGAKVAHFDGLDAIIQPGFRFKVAIGGGDFTNYYTVTACSALTVSDADIYFTPESTEDWDNDAEIVIEANDVFYLNNESDWTTTHAHSGKEFIYTYHSPIGWYWQELTGTEIGSATSVGYGYQLTTDTSGTYDITDTQWLRISHDTSDVSVNELTGGLGGQIVTLSKSGTGVLTINSGASVTEDIRTRDGEDFVLDTYDTVTLQYQEVNSLWREISRNVERQNIIERQSSWTSEQVKALNDNPAGLRNLVTAPSSGYAIVLEGVLLWYDWELGDTAYGVAGQSIEFYYTAPGGTLLASIPVTGFLDQASAQFRWVYPITTGAIAPVSAAAIIAYMSGSNVTLGDVPLKFRVLYRKIKLGW